jgi:hypothetical protein
MQNSKLSLGTTAKADAERQSPRRDARYAHTHFCYRCQGYGRGRGGVSGWWRCTLKPCVKGREEVCDVHREQVRRVAREHLRRDEATKGPTTRG